MAASAKCLSRLQGSLVGAVVGDCLGAPFEGSETVTIASLKKFFDKVKLQAGGGTKYEFTDDTAMTRSVAYSLIDCKGPDTTDAAQRFVSEYFRESWRGYGSGVVQVFQKLKVMNCAKPHQPAMEQFDGTGSYGNGGAMRIAPVALYGADMSLKQLCELVDNVTRITHSHVNGVNGARLQCLAVQHILHHTKEAFRVDDYLDGLFKAMDQLEVAEESPMSQDQEDSSNSEEESSPVPKKKLATETRPYCKKLLKVKEIFHLDEVSRNYVCEELGNSISALGSVPTAIYCFILAMEEISDIEVENAFERTIQYAISLGGDTDTIATMAGAIAGAYYGLEGIPTYLYQSCEGATDALTQAEQLWNLSNSK